MLFSLDTLRYRSVLPYRLTTHPLVRALRRPWKIFQAWCACVVFGFPSRKLRVIGVTGTTGKTTTVHLIATALESAGYTVGAVSSIHVQVGTKHEKNRSGLTSLGPWQLQKLLAHMLRSGCHYAVVEVSSHALDQGRLWGTAFDVAVLTTFARDHLDYHRTLEDYAHAKRRLFRMVSHRPPKRINGVFVPRVHIVSLDDPKTVAFLGASVDQQYGVTFHDRPMETGANAQRIRCVDVQSAVTGTRCVVMTETQTTLLRFPLPGIFQVQNALLALAVGVSQGIEPARITRELSDMKPVPGRFERVDCGQAFGVIVDYAVTEIALSALYETVRALRPHRVLAIFGACGNRDRPKRPLMAEIVGRNADIVFLTNEDPFTEDPEQIFADLQKGLEKTSADVRIIPDRREAIRAAVRAAQPGDMIVATGKGAEETMRFADRTIPWSDRAAFEEALRDVVRSAA